MTKKTVFTAEQKASLEAAYSGGLVSTGASNSEVIEQLAEEIKLDVPVIKVHVHVSSASHYNLVFTLELI